MAAADAPDPSDDAAVAAVALSARLLDVCRALPGARATLTPLLEELRTLDARAALVDDKTRLAFWINIYNALLLDGFDRFGAPFLVPFSRLFERASWNVGGADFSLHVVEHALLRGNRRPPLHLRTALPAGDPRLQLAAAHVDPRIHFALNCGARSCPPIRSYTAAHIDAELDVAAASYVTQETRLDRAGGVVDLPRLMKYFAVDFGTREAQLALVARALGGDDGQWLTEHASTVRIRHASYDWRTLPRRG